MQKPCVSGWAGSTGKSSKRIPEIKEQIEGVKQAAKERLVSEGKRLAVVFREIKKPESLSPLSP